MEVRLKSSLTDKVDYLKTIHLSNRFSLKAERNRDKFSVLVFVLNLLSFCLTFFFFLSSSVWPFYFYFPPILPVFLTFRLCAWLSVCTPGPSRSHPPAFSDSPSASFHLFLYLSQWELMWPLCAVSWLRGRQSSSAPIRTALSGAVSTTGLPTHSAIHVHHPPNAGWAVERKEKRASDTEKARQKRKNREKVKRKRSWHRQNVFSLRPPLIHSLLPSLLHHPSLIVFTPRYLCFGP